MVPAVVEHDRVRIGAGALLLAPEARPRQPPAVAALDAAPVLAVSAGTGHAYAPVG